MKNLFKIIFIIFCILYPSAANAVTDNAVNEIKFIYINGSNNNDKKMKKWFYDGINKMHANIIKTFLNSEFIEKYFLEENKYHISPAPEAFFWGDESSEEIDNLNSDLKRSKFFSPKLAQTVRIMIAHYLHDAIWISHYRNMFPVINLLHKKVMLNYKKNNPVILLGYSAGAFVSYEYIFYKLPYINLEEYFSKQYVPGEFLDYIVKHKKNNTCMDALIQTNLAVYNAEGKLVPATDSEMAKAQYNKMDEYTQRYCVPKGAIKGIVNFANPQVLFYSDLSNKNYPLNYYTELLYQYLLENNMFFITVNYADDPFGYCDVNNKEYLKLSNNLKNKTSNNIGFIYSKNDIKSGRTFLWAHTSYWSTSKKFSKALLNAYTDGYSLYNLNDI